MSMLASNNKYTYIINLKGVEVMSIVIIGGHERMESQYKSIGLSFGYKTKVYTKASQKLNNGIGNPDAIIILTTTVSHKMSMKAEEQAKKKDIPILRSHSSSKVAFRECMKRVEMCIGDCSGCSKRMDCF